MIYDGVEEVLRNKVARSNFQILLNPYTHSWLVCPQVATTCDVCFIALAVLSTRLSHPLYNHLFYHLCNHLCNHFCNHLCNHLCNHFLLPRLSLFITCTITFYRFYYLLFTFIISSITLCHFFHHSLSFFPSLFVISSITLCHFFHHSLSFLPSLFVISSITLCHFFHQLQEWRFLQRHSRTMK